MVLLNRKDQKIKHNSISTEQLDEESVHKAEGEAVDQIRYQFRNCKEKKNNLHFQLYIKLRHPQDTKVWEARLYWFWYLLSYLFSLAQNFLFFIFSE